MFRIEKFLGSMRVSRKLTATFAVVIAMMATASVVGLVTTRSHIPRLDRMVKVEAFIAFEGADARAVLNELRENEKDVVLHVGDAAAVTKFETDWTEHYNEQIHTLDALDKAATEQADHDFIAHVRKLTLAYGAGFKKAVADIKSGALKDTPAALAAVTPIADPMDELDEAITKWYEGHEEKTVEDGQAIEAGMSRALLFTFAMTLVALVVSLALLFETWPSPASSMRLSISRSERPRT